MASSDSPVPSDEALEDPEGPGESDDGDRWASLGDTGDEGEPCLSLLTPTAVARAAARMLMYRGYAVRKSEWDAINAGIPDETAAVSANKPVLLATALVPPLRDAEIKERVEVVHAQDRRPGAQCRLFLCAAGLMAKSTAALRHTMEEHGYENDDVALVISTKALRTQTKVSMSDWDFDVEVVSFEDLRACAPSHCLTAPHFVMSTSQIEIAERIYGHKRDKWQRLLVTDPLARFYGLRTGDAVFELRRTGAQPAFENLRYVT